MLKPGEYWAVLDKAGDIEEWAEAPFYEQFLGIDKRKFSEKHCVKVRVVRAEE